MAEFVELENAASHAVNRFVAMMIMAGAIISASPSEASEVPEGVVELFTSQGCSSCPAADKLLLELAESGKVIALGYHVDYWDYRGWRDTLGKPEFTRRQQDYARSLGLRGVYTPQAVINGGAHVNGADRPAIESALAGGMVKNGKWPVDLAISKGNESVTIIAGSGDTGDQPVHLVLVFFDREKNVHIERGENEGRTITYANVVTGMQTAGLWHGAPRSYELPRSALAGQGDGGCAALLQTVSEDGLPGKILGAAILRDP